VQREQGSLSAIFYRLAGDPDSLDRASIVAQIETTEHDIARIVSQVPSGAPDIDTWNHLAAVSSAFAEEAHRLVLLDHPPSLQSRELLRRHDEVLATVGRLIRATHDRSRAAKDRIEALAAGKLQKDAVLLG